MNNSQKGMSKLVPIIVIVAVLIAGGAYYTFNNNSSVATAPASAVATTPSTPLTPVIPSAGITVKPATPVTSTSGYKDGTYSAEGSYPTPEDIEKISVTVTLKDGIIVNSSLVQQASNQKSSLYQGVFAGGYKEFVIGKKITDVNVGVISGSSLTGKGFNAAIANIAQQAKA